MAAPASEDLRELERILTVAAETGDAVTRSRVQEEFQVAAAPAQEMLDTLRANGKAVEVAPGEWRGPTLDELEHAPAEPGPVVVRVPDEAPDGEPEYPLPEHRRELEEAAARAGVEAPPPSFYPDVDPAVRITRLIAEQLTDDALGQLVKAGLASVEDGETFLLEVTP